MRPLLVALALAALLCGAYVIAQEPAAESTAVEASPAELFVPDEANTRAPWNPPNRGQVIYASKIVLEGPTCRIVLDATSRIPGVTVTSKMTGDKASIYLTQAGLAVAGVQGRPDRLTAALYSDATGEGKLLLGNARGIHYLSGDELDPRNNRWHAMPSEPPKPVAPMYPVRPPYCPTCPQYPAPYRAE